MSLILVTGTSTSGKSTIAKELSKRGFVAYDTEHDGISIYLNKKTAKDGEIRYVRDGAIIVDATRPLKDVVDEILDNTL